MDLPNLLTQMAAQHQQTAAHFASLSEELINVKIALQAFVSATARQPSIDQAKLHSDMLELFEMVQGTKPISEYATVLTMSVLNHGPAKS